jgi:hypothetical protein
MSLYPSKLEYLPDEILLQICLYLRSFEIIDGFGQLNDRFDRTISQYRHNSDIHHLTLTEYRRWHSHLLPYVAKHTVNLVLSNCDSPGQICLFNRSIEHYTMLRQLFPRLQQLRLIGFNNNDIDILPKLSMIERLFICVDALTPLLHSTECLLDRYLFRSSFALKEIRLWIDQVGIRLQPTCHMPISNPHLKRVTICLARIDDLIALFRRAPHLVQLNVQISDFSSKRQTPQYVSHDIMPKNLTVFHLLNRDQKALMFDDLFTMMIHIPSIQHLSIDIDTNDVDYADGLCWMFLKSRLPKLKKLNFSIRLWIGMGKVPIDVEPFLASFQRTQLPVTCYADTKVLHIDTIPYDMHKVEIDPSITTSPFARTSKATNNELSQRRAYTIRRLSICGRYEPTVLNDWLYVLHRFPCVRALDLTAINISTSSNKQIDIDYQCAVRLPRLIVLRYVRSQRCDIDVGLFLLLVTNRTITPYLRALTVMYGDLIYLCKRLPELKFDRIQELCLFNSNTDGRIIPQDIHTLLHAFSMLHHFTIYMQSSRSINRHIEQIVNMIVSSLPHLISVRIVCKYGSFRIHSLTNKDNRDDIHSIFTRKEIAIWK